MLTVRGSLWVSFSEVGGPPLLLLSDAGHEVHKLVRIGHTKMDMREVGGFVFGGIGYVVLSYVGQHTHRQEPTSGPVEWRTRQTLKGKPRALASVHVARGRA